MTISKIIATTLTLGILSVSSQALAWEHPLEKQIRLAKSFDYGCPATEFSNAFSEVEQLIKMAKHSNNLAKEASDIYEAEAYTQEASIALDQTFGVLTHLMAQIGQGFEAFPLDLFENASDEEERKIVASTVAQRDLLCFMQQATKVGQLFALASFAAIDLEEALECWELEDTYEPLTDLDAMFDQLEQFSYQILLGTNLLQTTYCL